jgi:DNA repair exonuclease SbcCD ATPase subunit
LLEGLTPKKPRKTKSETVEVIEDVPGSHQPLRDAPRRDHILRMEKLQEEGSSEELETKEAPEVELKRLKRAYERQLRHMKEEREDCLDTLREDYEERIQQLKDECRDKLELMKDECDDKLEEVHADGKKKKLELKKVQLRYQKKLELKKAEQKALEEKLKTTSFELKQTQSHLKKMKRNYEDRLEIARSDYAAGIKNGEGRTEHQVRCTLNAVAACFQETRRQ